MGFFLPEVTTEDWQQVVVKAGHHGCHNFSWGSFAAYFEIERAKHAEWIDDYVLHLTSPQGRRKTWLFAIGELIPDFRRTIPELQRLGPVYSLYEAALPGKGIFKEVVYDLIQVFDPASYPEKKKRYQRLTYPQRWMERSGYTIHVMTIADLPEVAALHEAWVERKLSQPGVYQIMFPRRRYYRCCELAAAQPALFAGFVVRNPLEEVVACRVLYREGAWAFDLAQFASDQVPSNATEYFATATMRLLYEDGVRWINTGASLNSALSQYKSHWPHQVRTHWTYSQQKST